jgi:NAD+ synthetase
VALLRTRGRGCAGALSRAHARAFGLRGYLERRRFLAAPLYRGDPVETLVRAGAEIIVNISASPYTMQKRHLRPRMLASTAARWSRPLLFVNQVGGQDDLVFDGGSLALDARGQVIARGAGARHRSGDGRRRRGTGARCAVRSVGRTFGAGGPGAGTRDYARRCGFRRRCSVFRRDSIGAGRVHRGSEIGPPGARRRDAVAILRRGSPPTRRRWGRAGHRLLRDPDRADVRAYLDTLASPLELAPAAPARRGRDLTAQNLQARSARRVLMALSNRQDRLLLTTGNKSEVATGYCTLYGDMAGGLAVISDAPKTLVYRLSRALNAAAIADGRPAPIPEATLTKPPSAELRPDQTDQDSLPPYDLLDAILEAHLVEGLDAAALAARGFARPVVDDVLRRVRTSEYKRRQMPPRHQDHRQGVRAGPALSDRARAGLTPRSFAENSGVPPKGLALPSS